MAGARPEQAILTRETDMTKTEETRRVIENMVDGLNDHRIADIGEFFCR
jgi:cytochrome c553